MKRNADEEGLDRRFEALLRKIYCENVIYWRPGYERRPARERPESSGRILNTYNV
jgi:hypothetical protein